MTEGRAQEEGRLLNVGHPVGKYRIVRSVGRGERGVVYEAAHHAIGKTVAVKVLAPHLAHHDNLAAQFLHAGEAASRIRHPHVVDVYDVGIDGSVPYLVMEFLEGEDLERRLTRDTTLEPAETANLMLPVVAALMAAHEVGVQHGDLKPSDIFLVRGPAGEPRPKVLDFGLPIPPSQSSSGSLEPAHDAANVDPRRDQYALGVILYRCVTGASPFPAGTAALPPTAGRGFTAPRERRPDLPPEMDALIRTAMKTSPAARFPSLLELGRALLPLADPPDRAAWAPLFAPAVSEPPPMPSPARKAPDGEPSSPRAVEARTPPGKPAKPPSRIRRRRLVLIATGLLAAAGLARWLFPTNSAVPSGKPTPSTYEVRIRAEPATAVFELDGRIEDGPLLVRSMPKDGTPHIIRVSAEGHVPVEFRFVDAPPPHRVVLQKRGDPDAMPDPPPIPARRGASQPPPPS